MSIFTVVNVFSPGVKGGGPSQSLVHLLRPVETEVRVFTSARDLDGASLDVLADRWVNWSENPNIKVFYSSKRGCSQLFQIFRQMRQTNHSTLWVNSFFDIRYSLLPRLIARMRGRKVVISPRGELMGGALSTKKAKKIFFLYLLRVIPVFSKSSFHFTSEEERTESIRYLGRCDNFLFPNFSRAPMSRSCLQSSVSERAGSHRLVFLARLVPKKGLDVALRILAELDQKYVLEIFGDFESLDYEMEIKELIRALNLFDRVLFRGFVPFSEALPQITSCQLMLAPTRGENFGHSIYECLSIGLPVVISDQTPWQGGLGIKVCKLNDIGCYVKKVTEVTTSNAFELAENALERAQDYYETLPSPASFLTSIEAMPDGPELSLRIKQSGN